MKKAVLKKCNRSYKLRLNGGITKMETARYTHARFLEWSNYWVGRLFFSPKEKFSTKGMGSLSNKAKHKAMGILRAQRESAKATGNKVNVPVLKNVGAYATLEKSKNSFDYWISISNQWGGRPIKIPANSHKALNHALKNHWKLSKHCEFKWERGVPVVYVFVSKQVPKAIPKGDCIGADVGINKSVTFSDGYKGESLKPILDKVKQAGRERYRQRMKFGQIQRLKSGRRDKSVCKRILDHEANELIGRAKALGSNVVVESRKTLQNLRTGRLAKWARCYFAQRMETLCKENSIFFLEVNPWQSSKICAACGEIGEREGEEFACKNSNCSEFSHRVDADENAAKVLKSRGRLVVEKYFPAAIMEPKGLSVKTFNSFMHN